MNSSVTIFFLLFLFEIFSQDTLPDFNGRCRVGLTESMPENMTYFNSKVKHVSTFAVWKKLLETAEEEVKVTAFYWTLTGKDLNVTHPSTEQGERIFEMFKDLKRRGVNLKIAQNGAKKAIMNLDEILKTGAEAQYLDFKKIFGSGVLHNKIWIVDNRHGYIGSANMDFRSLTQVKELGLYFCNCPEIMEDLGKIFDSYWLIGKMNSTVPEVWPKELDTNYNMTQMMTTTVNDETANLFLTMSPPNFRAPGRTNDLTALLDVIGTAKKFVYISVMTYSPEIVVYSDTNVSSQFWPVIDDALRRVALNDKVEVRLLISRWKYTAPSQRDFLNSFKSLNGVKNSKLRVREFIVPAYDEFQQRLDHARVNHNKYMVTDNKVFIGTSNWSGDYFLMTGGTSFVSVDTTMNEESLRQQAVDVFLRDWNSEFAFEL